jgi:hypothetical protein
MARIRSSLANMVPSVPDPFVIKKNGWRENKVAIFTEEQLAKLPKNTRETTLAEAIREAARYLYGS